MKIWLILIAILQSIWSVEAGFFSFRYLVGLNIFWSFVVCSIIGVIDLSIYYFVAEQVRRLFIKWPYLNSLIQKIPRQKNETATRWCHRYGRWGLFLTAFIPHLVLVGIAAQKILKLKNGYWFLLTGSLAKVAALAYGVKIFEYFVC